MHPVAIRDLIVSVLEDHETDDRAVPADRFASLAESLTESWLKDRQRAIAEVRRLLDRAAKPDEQLFAATIHQMLRDAAADLGVDEAQAPIRANVEPWALDDSPEAQAARAELAARIDRPGWRRAADAPSGPPSPPESAENASGVGRDANGERDTSASAYPGQFFWGES